MLHWIISSQNLMKETRRWARTRISILSFCIGQKHYLCTVRLFGQPTIWSNCGTLKLGLEIRHVAINFHSAYLTSSPQSNRSNVGYILTRIHICSRNPTNCHVFVEQIIKWVQATMSPAHDISINIPANAAHEH